jgi:hypothetical protein
MAMSVSRRRQPALHYELAQVSKIDILRKLKKRSGGKTIRDIRFRVLDETSNGLEETFPVKSPKPHPESITIRCVLLAESW